MRVAVIRHHDVDSASFVGEAFEARGAELDLTFIRLVRTCRVT
jgi:hypothetical protein